MPHLSFRCGTTCTRRGRQRRRQRRQRQGAALARARAMRGRCACSQPQLRRRRRPRIAAALFLETGRRAPLFAHLAKLHAGLNLKGHPLALVAGQLHRKLARSGRRREGGTRAKGKACERGGDGAGETVAAPTSSATTPPALGQPLRRRLYERWAQTAALECKLRQLLAEDAQDSLPTPEAPPAAARCAPLHAPVRNYRRPVAANTSARQTSRVLRVLCVTFLAFLACLFRLLHPRGQRNASSPSALSPRRLLPRVHNRCRCALLGRHEHRRAAARAGPARVRGALLVGGHARGRARRAGVPRDGACG